MDERDEQRRQALRAEFIADHKRARNTAEAYLAKLGLPVQALLKMDTAIGTRADKKQEHYWRPRFTDPRGTIWLDIKEDQLRELSRTRSDGKALIINAPIGSEAVARQHITRLIRALRWEREFPEIESMTARTGEDRIGWIGNLPRKAHEIRFEGQGISLVISGQGEVIQLQRMIYTPAPAKPVERISANQAIAIADQCIYQKGLKLLPNISKALPSKRIVQPNTFWEPTNWKGDKYINYTELRDDISRVAWVVVPGGYIIPDHERGRYYGAKEADYAVHVDIETGEVIGGGHRVRLAQGI